MSHIVSTKLDFNREHVPHLQKAVQEVGGKWQGWGEVQTYSTRETGYRIQLPGWKYPVVFEEDGTVKYDNFNGNWGEQGKLDTLLQLFTNNVIQHSAKKLGYKEISRKINEKGQLVVELVGR